VAGERTKVLSIAFFEQISFLEKNVIRTKRFWTKKFEQKIFSNKIFFDQNFFEQ
jgi:hypothetical protein